MRTLLRYRRKGTGSVARLQQLRRRVKAEEEYLMFEETEIIKHLKEVKKLRRRLQINQWSNRCKYLKHKMKKCMEQNKVEDAKIIQTIINAENRRYQFRRIKQYVGKEKNALKCLLIPPQKHPWKNNDQEEFIVRKKEMEDVLIARNSKHLNQAHTSEVVQSGCIKEIANEIVKQQILDGKYDTTLNDDFNEFSKGLKSKKRRTGNVIIREKLTEVYKRVKGGKASAHSIISYGVLKCFSQSEPIMEFMSRYYTKIIQNRITLKLWKRAIAVMLEKGKGPRLDKLRIIQLICCNLQLLMRAVIIPVASEIVEENKLNLSQYARKKATTMSALVEKRLMLDSAVLTRDDCVWLVSDMTACYDRHIREIGEVLLTSHGVNEDSAATLIKALGEMKTHVQTSFGVSKGSYRSTEDEPQYGTGQGNIVSVFCCQFGTSVIFYILDEAFRGWDITDENGKVIGSKISIGFVDDTDFFVRRSDNTIEIVGKLYKKYIRLYQSTGGLISLDKSVFFHWRWQFKDGKMQVTDISEVSEEIPLEQVPASDGIRTLGMKLDPGLMFHDATKFIISKMIDFQMNISGAPFVRNDATVAYRSFFTSKVFYGIEAISLTPNQCKQINKTWVVP